MSRGTLDLYKMLSEYSIFEVKVFGFSHLTVSAMYKFRVGKVHAKDSVMICPLADCENASICPGVSKIT